MGLHVQEAHLKVWIWIECENAISVTQPLCLEFAFCLNLDFTREAVPSTGLTELCQEVVCVVLPSSDTHLLTKQTPCFSRIKVYHFLIGVVLVTCLSSCKRGWGDAFHLRRRIT